MNIAQITNDFSITSQIHPDQMPAFAAKGFRAIICARPDGEEAGQPSFAQLKAAASAAGIEMRHIPIAPNAVGPADVTAFGAALKSLPAPIVGYCKTGKRAAALYNAVAGKSA